MSLTQREGEAVSSSAQYGNTYFIDSAVPFRKDFKGEGDSFNPSLPIGTINAQCLPWQTRHKTDI